jgi:hypothetical protein
MPNHMMVESTNGMLSSESIAAMQDSNGLEEVRERLAEPGSLPGVAADLLGWGEAEVAYLDSMPTVLHEAVRAVVVAALGEGKPVVLQYSPAYDFEVRVWDFGEGVSVHVSGPYPPAPREAFFKGRTMR